jgi:hypothetical protein
MSVLSQPRTSAEHCVDVSVSWLVTFLTVGRPYGALSASFILFSEYVICLSVSVFFSSPNLRTHDQEATSRRLNNEFSVRYIAIA